MTTVTMKNGDMVTAQLGKTSDEGLTLILPDGEEQFIERSSVETFTDPLSSMPPMGLIMTKREIRDVVEYLSGLGVE